MVVKVLFWVKVGVERMVLVSSRVVRWEVFCMNFVFGWGKLGNYILLGVRVWMFRVWICLCIRLLVVL